MAATDFCWIAGMLRRCATERRLFLGRQLHVLLLKSGHLNSLFASNSLLQMYTRCSTDSHDVHKLFDEIPHRNDFSWNSLIDFYLSLGKIKQALALFSSMPERNPYSWNSIITGTVKHGELTTARKLFDEMPNKDPIAFNALIHGYIRNGISEEAFKLCRKISSLCDDDFVLTTVVSACADQKKLGFGKQLHSRIIANGFFTDSFIGSALIDMYGKCKDLNSARFVLNLMREADDFSVSAMISGYASCGRLADAREIFNTRSNPGVVVWNSIINCYVANDRGEEALDLYMIMRKHGLRGDESTSASIFIGCMSSRVLEFGKQVHCSCSKLGFLNDVVVASTLMDFYSKLGFSEEACTVFDELRFHDTIVLNSMISVYSNCGRIADARKIFDSISLKSSISWNSMIVGYSQNSFPIEALALFAELHNSGLFFDEVALSSAISAAASICMIGLGEQIFAASVIRGLDSHKIVSTAVIDLYCKGGNITDGRKIFDGMMKSDIAPWNSMLMGYASNGYGVEVLELFETMRNCGVRPNQVTFISVLSGCCHCGHVEEGLRFFEAMKEEYEIEPIFEHYSCIVDLLVRARRLKEAIDFIEKMPYGADASMWTSVLGGCMACGDESLGREVARRVVELNPDFSGPYLQISGLHAAHGDWERSTKMREIMKQRNIVKNPGVSWVDNFERNLLCI